MDSAAASSRADWTHAVDLALAPPTRFDLNQDGLDRWISMNFSSQGEVMASVDFDAFARFYDSDYRNYDDDLQLIVDLAHAAGERALELGCGTGRALLPLAAVGHLVTGVDGSRALLQIAREKAASHRLSSHVRLVHEDLRTLQLPDEDPYDLVYCVSNTLMHLTSQDDQLAVLGTAYRHLRPNGLLLIDLFNPDPIRFAQIDGVQELADSWEEQGGVQVFKWTVRRTDLSAQQQQILFLYQEIFEDGRVKTTPISFPLRFVWPSEGALMLRMAGFVVEAVYGDFEGTPFDSASERLIYLARKPK